MEQGKRLERKEEARADGAVHRPAGRLPRNCLMEHCPRRLATKEAASPPMHRG